jgi:N-acetylglutamate synthase-like GNAT family acetyltransferase
MELWYRPRAWRAIDLVCMRVHTHPAHKNRVSRITTAHNNGMMRITTAHNNRMTRMTTAHNNRVSAAGDQLTMRAELSLRHATLSDVDAIANLVNRAFRVERFFVEGDRISASEVRDRLATGRFILAERDNDLIGSVYVELRGEQSYVGLLAVDPSQQRNGIGRRLMAAAEDCARANQCRSMDLRIVNLRDELPAFYRRLGYVETGVAPFPSAVTTKMACHFVTMAKTL